MEEIRKDNINFYLNQLSKEIKKMFKGMSVDLIIVGGASILINYDFRDFTYDIDIIKQKTLDIKSIITKISEKNGLRYDWLNDKFMYSKTYSDNLYKVREFYRGFNGVLNVYTVKDIYLLVMKMISYREDTNDYDDVINLINVLKSNTTIKDVYNACVELYGSYEILNTEAVNVVLSLLAKVGYDLCPVCGSYLLELSAGNRCLNCDYVEE